VRAVAMTLDFIVLGIVIGVCKILLSLVGVELESIPLSIPALAVMHVYATTRAGRTLGKAVMELEVVDIDTLQRPPLARAIRRSLMLFGFPIVATWVEAMIERPEIPTTAEVSERGAVINSESLFGLLVLLWVIACLVNLMHASLRVSGRRTWWDRVARTMVRYRTTRRSLAGS
jgi:uncharacterized RDD family membrane protein YckC